MKAFELEEYLSNGVEKIVTGILKASVRNPKESIFMMQYVLDSKKARHIRKEHEEKGEHIPPFLIASITTQCNLHCKGCYARANHHCHDLSIGDDEMLPTNKWGAIFQEAEELGIGFILLARGEPFLRIDVLKEAAKYKKILFPVFTNGILLGEAVDELLDKNRNLIPVLSIEGDEATTDSRRGSGTYKKLISSMDKLKSHGIIFAASVTVTRENMNETVSHDFVQKLAQEGCKGIIYVEYVPVDAATSNQALEDDDRVQMLEKLDDLRKVRDDMVLIAFPGDEKSSGGCLAAGRGFFHINAHGGAEPCPFSPYSDVNLKNMSIKEALKSPLFLKLKENGNLENDHIGGCTLFGQEEEVRKLLEI